MADPEEQLSIGYVMNHMGNNLTGDPRQLALIDSVYASLDDRAPRPPHHAAAALPRATTVAGERSAADGHPVEGEVVCEDGSIRPFTGWLGLVNELERVVAV